jgi:Flp pilus assembly pilin Flp
MYLRHELYLRLPLSPIRLGPLLGPASRVLDQRDQPDGFVTQSQEGAAVEQIRARWAEWWAQALAEIQSEPGQTNVEYALILTLIAVATAAAFASIGQGVGVALTSVNAAFP